MRFSFINNGLAAEADFPDADVQTVYRPLLAALQDLQKKKGRRILVMLAAPPGAGKSTLAAFLQYLAQADGMTPVTVIGMDGFHRDQDYLLHHYTVRDGERIPLVRIKGAPETFDLQKLEQRVRKVALGEVCGWPAYDRLLHNPIEDAVTVEGDIILLEGNYLLLDEPGWRDLAAWADYTIFLEAPEELLRQRLVERQTASGKSSEEAARFVAYSDLVNARLVLARSRQADRVLKVRETQDIG